jgi:hypothetical protein
MATLREAIYTILHTDAQSAVAGSLGVLLGYHATTKPQCVFFAYPPKEPDLPLVTYMVIAEQGFKPRERWFTVTAWGDNFDAVQDRIFDLLHQKIEVTATDFDCKGILFEWAGPDLWDDDLKTYYKQARYRVVAWNI